MSTPAQSWRRTETGRDKPCAWRRPGPRGWGLVPISWAVLGLALWTSRGDSPSMAVELRVAVGFSGLFLLVVSALLIAGSNYVWPVPLTLAGAFAVVISPLRPLADYGSWSLPPASGLLDAPVVLLRRWWKQRELVLTDMGGRVLASVRETPHPRAEDGMRAAFDFQIAVAPRYVIRVDTPGGEPLFFIDGAEMQTGGTAPNGAGLVRRTGLWSVQRRHFKLLDADGVIFGQYDYGPKSPKVRRLIRFRERTPVEPRMVAIASMIIDGSEGRTDVLAPDASVPEPYPGFGDTHASYYRRPRTFADQILESYWQQAD